MTSKEHRHIKRLYDRLSRTSYVCLADSSNPFASLRSEDRHKTIAAFVAASEFNCNFELMVIPPLEKVIELYNEYNHATPEVLHLVGGSYSDDFNGTQYADFNVQTLELHYTHYSVLPSYMFNSLHGKGQIPVDDYGDFSIQDHIPMD